MANNKEIKSILVLCPKSLRENWIRECRKWLKDGEIDNVEIYSKEQFKKYINDISKKDAIIIDEVHYWGSLKSQLFKKTKWYLDNYNIKYRYFLTATSYLSSPWNIYTLAKMLGRDWNYINFRNHFFYQMRIGGRMIYQPRKGIEKEIATLVARLGNTVKMSDCVDVPDTVFLTEYFEITKEQEQAFDELNDFLPLQRYTAEHQILGGVYKNKEYKSEKLSRLLDIVKEYKKLAIVCRYTAELDLLHRIISKMGKNVHIISGQVKDRQAAVDKVNSSDEVVVLINAMCSEGYGIPNISTMIFYSYDFSLKNYIQMIGRIQRIDNIQKCVYISLLTKDEVDEAVYECIQRKEDFDAEIYDRDINERKIKR